MAKVKVTVTVKGTGKAIKRLRNAQGRFEASTSLVVDDIAQNIVSVIKLHTPVASRTLVDSTEHTVTRTHNTWRIGITQTALGGRGVHVAIYRGFGRQPGGNPPWMVIRQWILDVGLTPDISRSKRKIKSMSINQLAFAISRSIGQHGTAQFRSSAPPYWEDALSLIEQIITQSTQNIKVNIQASFRL